MFDSNANIEFTPNVETVKGAVFDVMRDTVSLLSSLPRVLYHVRTSLKCLFNNSQLLRNMLQLAKSLDLLQNLSIFRDC